jgi:hypothetical protein
LLPYRETIDNDDHSIASRDSFHSIEDYGERDGNQSTQDDMILSDSIVNVNIQNLIIYIYIAYSFILDKESALRIAEYLVTY